MPDHAHTARLAHRVLRLRENGVDSHSNLAKIAADARRHAESSPPPQATRALAALRAGDLERAQEIAAEPVIVQAPVALGLGGIAQSVLDTLDPDVEGPTDPKLVERLMGYSLDDLWKVWDEAVTANVESLLEGHELSEWRKSVERDQREFEERCAAMAETGHWPAHPAFGHARAAEGAANALYDLGREGFADGSVQWTTPTIKVALVDSAVYAVNLATHQFMSSVASSVAVSGALTTKTKAAGVCDADDVTFANVSGAQSEALILFQSSAVGGGADVAAGAQRLIGYIDTATGLPVTPNGGNINVIFDSGANRIFKL